MKNTQTLKRKSKRKTGNSILLPSLLSVVLVFLTACQTTNPPFPRLSKEAKAEIEEVCAPVTGQSLGEQCRAIEEWFQRLEKLKRQLDD